MRRTILVCTVWLALLAVSAYAVEPPAQPQPGTEGEASVGKSAELPERVIPERELVFDVSQRPYPRALTESFLADPEDGEFRYVVIAPEAAATGQPERETNSRREPPADLPDPVIPERKLEFDVSEEPYHQIVPADFLADPENTKLRYVAIVRLAVPAEPDAWSLTPTKVIWYLKTEEYGPWQSLVSAMPKARQPAEDVVAEFQSSFPRLYQEDKSETDQAGVRYEMFAFEVRAATVEHAKELVRGLLTILDHGLSCKAQQLCLWSIRVNHESIAEDQVRIAEQKEELTQLERKYDELEEFKDLDTGALSGLKTQQRLIVADIAGANAQIEACQRMLAKLRTEKTFIPSRIEQVESLKIAAEIELVGLTARKNAIDEIVQKGQTRFQLARQIDSVQRTISRHENDIAKKRDWLTRYEPALIAIRPFPIRGKIMIHPIEWRVDQ